MKYNIDSYDSVDVAFSKIFQNLKINLKTEIVPIVNYMIYNNLLLSYLDTEINNVN